VTTYMVVEDEPDLYEMLTAMSKILEVNEVAFATGEEAVTWIEEVEHGLFDDEMPILALIDIRLPGEIDGPMVGERIRQCALLKDIAIVLMTAYHLSVEDEQEVMQQCDADLLLYKPLPKFTELRDVLRTTAEQRIARTQTSASKDRKRR
jgi:CheY-like chemotaxis protein